MVSYQRSRPRLAPSLPLLAMCAFFVLLAVAGGASRADVAGQVATRAGATILLIVVIVSGKEFEVRGVRPVAWLLLAAILLPLLQLLPLPPGLWQTLPGRAILTEAVSGEAQPWRPLSMVPGATANAAASLGIAVTAFVLARSLTSAERVHLPTLLLVFIAAETLVGLLQFSGVDVRDPLVNATPGQVAGTFANRNHFALLLALGCLIGPAWAYLDDRQTRWRAPLAVGMVLLFLLTILASGSRVGMVLGVIGLGSGLWLVLPTIRGAFRRFPRWAFPALVVGMVALIGLTVWISVSADRAVSVDRLFMVSAGDDMRRRGLPTVWSMAKLYFPAGTGLGSFDPLFRMHEPFSLLKPTYFNHAHNDFLEIVLDAGVAGLILLLCGVAWWGWASVSACRPGGGRSILPRLGSATIALVFVASMFDYPARTPIIMAVLVIAAIWLADRSAPTARVSFTRK